MLLFGSRVANPESGAAAAHTQPYGPKAVCLLADNKFRLGLVDLAVRNHDWQHLGCRATGVAVLRGLVDDFVVSRRGRWVWHPRFWHKRFGLRLGFRKSLCWVSCLDDTLFSCTLQGRAVVETGTPRIGNTSTSSLAPFVTGPVTTAVFGAGTALEHKLIQLFFIGFLATLTVSTLAETTRSIAVD